MEAILESTAYKTRAAKDRRRTPGRMTGTLACALAVAAAALTSAGLWQASAEALGAARAELAVAQGSLAGQREALAQVIGDTPEGDARTAAEGWLADGPAEVPAEGPGDSIMAMGAAAGAARQARGEALDLAQEAYLMRAACLGAQKEAALGAARAEAEGPLAEAEGLSASDDIALASEGARGRLEAATCLVRLMGRADTFWDASQVRGATEDLQEATAAVKAEVDAAVAEREAAEAAARAAAKTIGTSAGYASEAAAVAAAPAGATTYRGSDGVWHIDYSRAHGTAEAASDGGVTEWADGYYIAHDWSDSGAKITGRTEYVEVNGQTYRLAGSKEVSRDTTWNEVEGWVHANGGIGMQTCVEGGGYLINHYEPVA
ncbi:hypothetical protein [Caniella muris]|uniref:hypothetical protein n=1 Tax=Caniella muris TaxID=2941502 RepID=UPI00203ED1B2|nr:hypothetical protein [Caniella muris]